MQKKRDPGPYLLLTMFGSTGTRLEGTNSFAPKPLNQQKCISVGCVPPALYRTGALCPERPFPGGSLSGGGCKNITFTQLCLQAAIAEICLKYRLQRARALQTRSFLSILFTRTKLVRFTLDHNIMSNCFHRRQPVVNGAREKKIARCTWCSL